jgi:hypothetical protein
MKWTWNSTTGLDVNKIVKMAQDHFETEIDRIFVPDPIAYARNLTLATVNQFYNPGLELLKVAKEVDTDRILAYVWAIRGEKTPWSDEELICVKIAHVDLSLPVRQRLRLVTGMVVLWETWARECGVGVVCSTTMRRDQSGFLDLHRRLGYDVRGSYAYKRLNTTQATPAVSLSPS